MTCEVIQKTHQHCSALNIHCEVGVYDPDCVVTTQSVCNGHMLWSGLSGNMPGGCKAPQSRLMTFMPRACTQSCFGITCSEEMIKQTKFREPGEDKPVLKPYIPS